MRADQKMMGLKKTMSGVVRSRTMKESQLRSSFWTGMNWRLLGLPRPTWSAAGRTLFASESSEALAWRSAAEIFSSWAVVGLVG